MRDPLTINNLEGATAAQVAALFGVPVSNVQKLYADNAQDLRAFAAMAGAGKYRGKTAREWAEFAEHAEKQSVG